MADANTYELENQKLLDALASAPKDVIPFLFEAMTDITFLIQGELGYAGGYPPSSEANSPGRYDQNGRPMGYYERGRGWWYPVVNEETLAGVDSVAEGAITEERAFRRLKKIKTKNTAVVGYKLAKNERGEPGTSEVLGKNWTTNVTREEAGVQGEVGTLVSYADFVQGYDVAAIHLSRGWEDMDTRVERLLPDIDLRLDQALGDYLESLPNGV